LAKIPEYWVRGKELKTRGRPYRRLLLALLLAGASMILLGSTVGASTAPEALEGLREYFQCLVDLAQKALDGYIEYLKAL